LLDGQFWGSDDWSHLEQAAWVAQGDIWEAFQLRVRTYSGAGQAALRQVATLLWGLDFALFGADPRAFYRTNLALHLLLGAGVWTLARRFGAEAAPAAAGTAVFVLQPETAETIWFLAARSEQLACLFALILLLTWPKLRGSWIGAALAGLLWSLALWSKTTAAWVPLVLLGRDALELPAGERWRAARLLRDGWGLGLAAAAYAAAVVGLLGVGTAVGYGPEGGGGGGVFAADTLVGAVAGGLFVPWWQPGVNVSPSAWSWLRLGMLVAALLCSLAAWRRTELRVGIGVTALWLVASLLLPSPLIGQGMDAGRYLLPAAAACGVLSAVGLSALKPGMGAVASLGLIVAAVGAFLEPGGGDLRTPDGPDLDGLVAGLEELIARPDSDSTARVAMQHPESQDLRLLARGGLLAALVPGLTDVELAREGEDTGWRVPRFDATSHLLADCNEFEPSPAAVDPSSYPVLHRRARAWRSADPIEFRQRPVEPVLSWEFGQGLRGWTSGPVALNLLDDSTPPRVTSSGVHLRAGSTLVAGSLADVDPRRVQALRGPLMGLVPPAICGVRVALEVHAQQEPRPTDCRGIQPERFALFTWTGGEHGRLGPHILLPLQSTRELQVVEADLDLAPSWRSLESIERIALVPSNLPGGAVVHRIDLLGCDEHTALPDEYGPPPPR
jgi:hypothetical protein